MSIHKKKKKSLSKFQNNRKNIFIIFADKACIYKIIVLFNLIFYNSNHFTRATKYGVYFVIFTIVKLGFKSVFIFITFNEF